MLKWKCNILQNNFYWPNVQNLNLGIVCFFRGQEKSIFVVQSEKHSLNVKGYLKFTLLYFFLYDLLNTDCWTKWSTGDCTLTRSSFGLISYLWVMCNVITNVISAGCFENHPDSFTLVSSEKLLIFQEPMTLSL